VVIETARLRLRLLAPQDAALYVALYTNADVMRHIAPPLSTSDAQTSFAVALKRTHTKPVKQLFFAIERQADQQTIGICGMMQLHVEKKRAEVGNMLLPPAHGMGFGKESLAAITALVFRNWSVDQIWVEYAGSNASVVSMVSAVGFVDDVGEQKSLSATSTRIGFMSRKEWMQHG
jgi:[ribosomal protein S5]-alanine N-acetyltransferase